MFFILQGTMTPSHEYCLYYQAQVERERTWLFVATLRFHEHLAFDRTCDVATGTFEFFVPAVQQEPFERLMRFFTEKGIVKNCVLLPNRLSQASEPVVNGL